MMRVVTFLALFTGVAFAVVCLDENSQPVPWFFIYKQPNGFRFAYKDARDTTLRPLSIHSKLLNRTATGALGATLHQVYVDKRTNRLAHVLYNDDPPYKAQGETGRYEVNPLPEGASEEQINSWLQKVDALHKSGDLTAGRGQPNLIGGHAKGVVAMDKNSGFWLIHSVPKFPDLRPPEFTWGASTIYAQHFLCLTIDTKNANALFNTLTYNWPIVFDYWLPSELVSMFPALQPLATGTRSKGATMLPLPVQGFNFQVYAKSSDWGKDLYEDHVQQSLKLPFRWETWRRDTSMPSYCKPQYPYESLNVMSMKFDSTAHYNYTMDHCKWGISSVESSPWVCVGDINRMTSQFNRGGGTACLQNKPLWAALNGVIGSVAECTK